MKRLFVCLANSYKEGGKCVGGILIEQGEERKYHVVSVHGIPQWIRPVSDCVHGQLTKELVEGIHILNIVEIDILGECPDGAHQENIRFMPRSMRAIGSIRKSPDILENFVDPCHSLVFDNLGKVVTEEDFYSMDYSLMFIKPSRIKFYEEEFEENKKKVRVAFEYKGHDYRLPVTDPDFLYAYRRDAEFVNRYSTFYLTLSLGIAFNGLHYKLAAGVIYL